VPGFPLARVDPVFRAMAESFVPELADADADTWHRVRATIADALQSRKGVGGQLVLLIRMVDVVALVRFGSQFVKLSPPARTRLLHALERAPISRIRRGIWGLRTLVFMGYYSAPEVAAGIGYRPNKAGWSAHA
jgi:hypothetical protein